MKRKKPSAKRTNPTQPWTEFRECNWMSGADGKEIPIPAGIRIYRNNVYQVNVEDGFAPPPFDTFTWLSIRRVDRLPIHDWRELQLIKNALCGPEREAVELYPRESRVVDTSNQMHLWVMPEGFTFPFGYAERLLIDETVGSTALGAKAKQRPWPSHQRPVDVLTGAEYDKRWMKDSRFGLQKVLHKRKVG